MRNDLLGFYGLTLKREQSCTESLLEKKEKAESPADRKGLNPDGCKMPLGTTWKMALGDTVHPSTRFHYVLCRAATSCLMFLLSNMDVVATRVEQVLLPEPRLQAQGGAEGGAEPGNT